MKKSNIILLLLMVLACLAACHKDKEMDVKEAVVSNEEMTVTETQAHFSWQVEFAGQFQTGVEVSQNENMADLRRVEASKQEDKFVAVVDSLTEGTNYYYRFVVWNKFGSSEHSVGNFKTMETPPAPGQDTTYFEITVSVNLPEGGTATGGGRFAEGDTCTVVATANEGYNFVNWTENGNQVSSEAEYSFAVMGDRNLMANFNSQEYTITATAEPEEGGTVNGSGGYNNGDECTLTATANEGYEFLNWTKEDGTIVSTDPVYAFTVTETATLVAHFQIKRCTIAVAANPNNGGIVDGGGTYEYGQSCTVHAIEADGYHFVNWTENGGQVSSNTEYTFDVTGDRDLIANFLQIPIGAIGGLFSVSDSLQVWFSQGNLQFQASSYTWRFAENQWDFIGGTDNNQQYGNVSGSSNTNVPPTGWVDLFGWGTSGYNHGAVCYQPWDRSENDSDYYAYGISTYNLYDQTGQADWGYNRISNGGNTIGQWRTLTADEWYFVFMRRSTPSGIRYAKAIVNEVNGVVLVPDDWDESTYILNSPNSGSSPFSSNIITMSIWMSVFHHSGAVFLPITGGRLGEHFWITGNGVGGGLYHTSSIIDDERAYTVVIYDDTLNPMATGSAYRNRGNAVRLVCPVR